MLLPPPSPYQLERSRSIVSSISEGLVVCLVSFGYAIAITSKVMPLFSQDVPQRFLIDQFGHFVEGDKTSSLDVLLALASQPWQLLVEIFNPLGRTIQYILDRTFPLAFIPLISPSTWALVAAPLLVLLLRDDSWALSMNMRFALLSNPHRALSFIIPDSFRPLVYASPVQQWERAKIINSFLAQIPSNASVSATTHIVPHISSRREMLGFPALELINDAKEKISVDLLTSLRFFFLWDSHLGCPTSRQDTNWLQ